MKYPDFIRKLSRRSNRSQTVVKEVLAALPLELLELEPGEILRTPIGTFRAVIHKQRTICLPGGFFSFSTPPRFVIKFKASEKLRKDLVVEEEDSV